MRPKRSRTRNSMIQRKIYELNNAALEDISRAKVAFSS